MNLGVLLMKKVTLQGTITALVTPFKKDGSVDFDALANLIDFQIDNKVDGIVVCGSTGESATLTVKEKMAIIIKAVEHADGRVPIIAGTGSNETHESLDLTTFAADQGADAVLLVAPYYNKPTQDGLFEHFGLIAETAKVPIMIYNVPGRTAVNIHPETQLKLAEKFDNIIATKEASGSLEQMMQIIRNAPKGFDLLAGDDALALPIISIGGKGVVSVVSNYAPKQFGDMIRTALKGDLKKAMKQHYDLLELMDLNFIESNPIPVKCALYLMGHIKEVYRLPLLSAKPSTKKKIKLALQTAGFIK